MRGRKGMARLLDPKIEKTATKMASNIEKEDFLRELKAKWYPYVKKHSDPEAEMRKASERISQSGPFKKAFEVVGITDEDIRKVITEIQAEKPEQVVLEEGSKIGRNKPCPCGSGKKYKKCCMGRGLKDGK